MSEASFIAGEPFPQLHRVPGSVGLAQCEVRIIDEQGAPLARHQTGEIVIRWPRVFPGYLDDPEANAAAFLPGGWFRTGDLGFLDDAGYLHLTDRLGEVINRGGEKIVPREVDEVLLGHPAVADAAIFGGAGCAAGSGDRGRGRPPAGHDRPATPVAGLAARPAGPVQGAAPHLVRGRSAPHADGQGAA